MLTLATITSHPQARALQVLSEGGPSMLTDSAIHVWPGGNVLVVDPKMADRPQSERSGQRIRRQTLATPESVDAYNVPMHHSRPRATNKMYINVQGEVVSGTVWNVQGPGCTVQTCGGGYDPITVVPFYASSDVSGPVMLTDLQRDMVTQIWMLVAEHYRPFNVDVTTERPVSGCSAHLTISSHETIIRRK